ncbi:hypothetical protein BC567DRAFT_75696 [Phyllosticta citribraziliensis]
MLGSAGLSLPSPSAVVVKPARPGVRRRHHGSRTDDGRRAWCFAKGDSRQEGGRRAHEEKEKEREKKRRLILDKTAIYYKQFANLHRPPTPTHCPVHTTHTYDMYVIRKVWDRRFSTGLGWVHRLTLRRAYYVLGPGRRPREPATSLFSGLGLALTHSPLVPVSWCHAGAAAQRALPACLPAGVREYVSACVRAFETRPLPGASVPPFLPAQLTCRSMR